MAQSIQSRASQNFYELRGRFRMEPGTMLHTTLLAILVSPQDVAVALAGGLLALMAVLGAGEIDRRESDSG